MGPPLYTRLSMPVYSLSTRAPKPAMSSSSSSINPDEDAALVASLSRPPVSDATMNLVTYAAPVSIQPRRFALGLYLGTLSHEFFKSSGHGVLQVMTACMCD